MVIEEVPRKMPPEPIAAALRIRSRAHWEAGVEYARQVLDSRGCEGRRAEVTLKKRVAYGLDTAGPPLTKCYPVSIGPSILLAQCCYAATRKLRLHRCPS